MHLYGFRSATPSSSKNNRGAGAGLQGENSRVFVFLDTSYSLTYNQANRNFHDSAFPGFLVLMNYFLGARANRYGVPFAPGRRAIETRFSLPSHRQSAFYEGLLCSRLGLDRSKTTFQPLQLQDGHDFKNFAHNRFCHRRICRHQPTYNGFAPCSGHSFTGHQPADPAHR
jgi:hypothetical protein